MFAIDNGTRKGETLERNTGGLPEVQSYTKPSTTPFWNQRGLKSLFSRYEFLRLS
jgi:hypothetical protein